MKLLHVVHGYAPGRGGSELLMQGISESLVRRYRDEVTVFTANGYNTEAFTDRSQPLIPTGESELNGVRVRRFAVTNRLAPFLYYPQRLAFLLGLPGNDYLRTWYQGPILPGLARAIESSDAELVAAASFPLLHMYTALRAGRRSGKPVVLVGALHPYDRWGFQRPMIYRAIREADAYVALSSFERDDLVEQWGVPAEKIEVLGAGIDPAPFEKAGGAAIRARYGFGARPVVAFIGQQGGHKGIDSLLLSMKLVWKERPDARLLVCGAPTAITPHLKRILAEMLTPAEQARVAYVDGFEEAEKPDLFAACDVFAYPSSHESFGIAFLEAWAAGKPVVGCRRGAVSNLVEEGVDGFLVPIGDPLSLGLALLRLVESPELRSRFGRAGRKKVAERYTWEVITRKWRSLYARLLGHVAAARAFG